MFRLFKSRSGSKYLYETSTNHFFEMDDASLRILPRQTGATQLLECFGEDFYAAVFGDGPIDDLSSYAEDRCADDYGMPDILVLELTQQCNYRCDYCIYSGKYRYERSHSDASLDEDDIDRICELFFSGDSQPENVSFYGGEPLLRFDLIKRFCSNVRRCKKSPKYSITTNCSMLADTEVRSFLVANDFHINVSFDGVNHDRYRKPVDGSNSSESVLAALSALNGEHPEYVLSNVSISATLAPPYAMLENARYFMEHPLLSTLRISVNLVNEQDNEFMAGFDLAREQAQLNADIDQLVNEYIDCEGKVPMFLASLFAQSAARIEDREMTKQSKGYPPGQCRVGGRRLFINSSGNMHMCERVGDFGPLGSLDAGLPQRGSRMDANSAISEYYRDNCDGCYLVRVCDMCCASMRRGKKLKSGAEAQCECDERRSWYELIFYAYLSRKELGKGMFGDED